MKCEFCGGTPRKNELIVSFGYYYCPFCGENMGNVRQYNKKKKKKGRKTERIV